MKQLLIAALILVACESEPQQKAEPVLCKPDTEKLQTWMLECIKNGNPKSDEEPEDLVLQCEATAVRMFCGLNCYRAIRGDHAGRVKCWNEGE